MRGDSFKEFILDQLRGLSRLECRPMFGGYGLYHGPTFFAILFKDRLYFKTDDASLSFYTEKGMKPFRPSAKQTLKSYYEVPVDLIEEPDELIVWARRAVSCQEEKQKGRRRRS